MGSKRNKTDSEYAAVCTLGNGCTSYAVSVSTTNATIALPPGQYLARLASADPTVLCWGKVAGEPTIPTDATGIANTFFFDGGITAMIEIAGGSATRELNVKLAAGATSTTLYVQRLP